MNFRSTNMKKKLKEKLLKTLSLHWKTGYIHVALCDIVDNYQKYKQFCLHEFQSTNKKKKLKEKRLKQNIFIHFYEGF